MIPKKIHAFCVAVEAVLNKVLQFTPGMRTTMIDEDVCADPRYTVSFLRLVLLAIATVSTRDLCAWPGNGGFHGQA